MLHFFRVTTFLWIILILHLSHTSLFLETAIIKFGGPRAEGGHMGPRVEGREKQIPSIYLKFTNGKSTFKIAIIVHSLKY